MKGHAELLDFYNLTQANKIAETLLMLPQTLQLKIQNLVTARTKAIST